MRTILLNPGPVSLSAGVRDALSGPDLCHREPEFATLQNQLREKLLRVYDCPADAWAAIVMTGSGTAAVEAMLLSCVPDNGRVLSVENGVYGDRMHRILSRGGINNERLALDWGAEITPALLHQALSANDYSHIAIVHHETTTGRLNKLGALAEVCAQTNTRMLLDGVSSFGAEHIDFDAWPIDACAATANKCLHGVPGTAFVITRRLALSQADDVQRSVYFDLNAYLQAQDRDGTPFTQSVQTFYALNQALDEFFQAGGRAARHRLFSQRMSAIGETLADLGVRRLLPAEQSSCVLHAFELPDTHNYADLHDALKARGFIIYAGQGALSAQVFRISAMGDIAEDDVERLRQALRDTLRA